MIKDGVVSAELASLLLSSKPSSTPVGEDHITNANINIVNGNPSTAPITNLELQQFKSLGEEGTQVYNNEGTVGYKNPNPATPRIVDAQYDKTFGVLSVVRDDGHLIEIDGMPVLSSLGIGPEGYRGEDGRDGVDGYVGRPADDGDVGCAGPQGPQGLPGDPGENGSDGPRGEEGEVGCGGISGPSGLFGPAGRIGDDGPTGPSMPACFSPRGPRGPQGRTALDRVIISAARPTTNCYVWGKPE